MALGGPVRRRSRDSGCQWLTIGMALGIGCSLVFCLASYIVGIIEIQGLQADDPTTAAVVSISTVEITATPEPASATPVITATEAAESAATDSVEPSAEAEQPTDAAPIALSSPTTLPEAAPNNSGANTTGNPSPDPAEIGTPVPDGGSPTITPSIGSGGVQLSAAPSALESAASSLVEIPSGAFTMGTTLEEGLRAVDECVNRDGGSCQQAYIEDSIPAHTVTLDSFQIELTEVTVTQYVGFLNHMRDQNPGTRVDLIGCSGQPCALTTADEPNSLIRLGESGYEVVNASFYARHPIIFVTWYGANAYCQELGRRLPSEAEWERAARGPANSIYPWGPEWVPTNANTSRSTDAGVGTLPVDSYPIGASVYGPLNMAGNVSEWVYDFYQSNYYSLPEAAGTNPRGPASSDQRVIRGGGWDEVPMFARTVHRMSSEPGRPRSSLGFRCAADAP